MKPEEKESVQVFIGRSSMVDFLEKTKAPPPYPESEDGVAWSQNSHEIAESAGKHNTKEVHPAQWLSIKQPAA